MCKLFRSFGLSLLLAGGAATVPAQNSAVAPAPPMGWNSWDAYGLTITEAQFRDNVNVLSTKLKPFGWQYAVIDEGWFLVNPQDRPTPDKLIYAINAHGQYVPVPARFPSAGTPVATLETADSTTPAVVQDTSFAALGAWVHAQGLKFGIHIVRGIPRAAVARDLPIEGADFKASDAGDTADACPWDPTNWGVKDNAAGQAWYDALLRQYAGWGVDLLKVDCIADHPYKLSEIQQIRRAIEKTGRPIVLSLSPGPTALAHAEQIASLTNMWRISNDEWDVWSSQGKDFPQGVKDQFPRLAAWEPYDRPGDWPDADMLPLGELKPHPGWGDPRTSRLTAAEERTEVSLWAIARSPLIVGANLTLLDAPTTALLTNRDLIRISQTSTHSAQVGRTGDLIVWEADLPSGEKALGIFNIGDAANEVREPLSELDPGLDHRQWTVREVWGTGSASKARQITETLPAHGCALLLLH